MTDAQARQRIETELDQNLLVEASAGSGKTESLARRMAQGLKRGVYQVEHLAAVTFTKQAASELRGRLQLRLEEALKQEVEFRPNVERALSRLEHLFAGTIHGFCGQLLRERPVEAGLTPGFREVEQAECDALRTQALHHYLDSQSELPILRELALGAHDLESAFEKLCDYSDVEFECEPSPRPDLEAVVEAVSRFRQRTETLGLDPKSKCPLHKQLLAFQGRTHVIPRNLGRLGLALGELEKETRFTASAWGKGPSGKVHGEAVLGEVNRFRQECVLPFLQQIRCYAYHPLLQLLIGARNAFEEERIRSGLLCFSDLLSVTARLLRDRPDVRAILSDKYRHLLVDEFQDTDPLQAEVLMWLTAEPDQSGTWNQLQLRPGALFVVGDPKQSIYRFRRADISVYQAVRQQIGNVVQLTHSFRSRPEICDWVNTVFRDLFPPELSDVQAPFAELESGISSGAQVAVRLLSVSAQTSTADALAKAEASRIADWIANQVHRKLRAPGDFLILTRFKPRIPHYVAALGRQGIPVESVFAGLPGQAGVTRAVLDLMLAVSDPEDALRVVAALRGPLIGCTDDELHLHRLSRGQFCCADRPTEGEPNVKAALLRLHEMVLLFRLRTPAAALEQILEETGALAWAAAESVGGTEAGTLLHVVDRVRQAVEQGGGLADAVASLVAELDSNRRDRAAWPLEPGRRDVVRVMNLHVSKGLESPVVILADPAGAASFPPELRVVRGERTLGFMRLTTSAGWVTRVLAQPPGWAAHLAEEERFQEAEGDRLLYVATTRARELLVISRVEDQGGGLPAKLSWGRLGAYTRGLPEIDVPELPPVQEDVPNFDPSFASQLRHDRRAAALHPSWSRRSVTAQAERQARFVMRALEAPDQSGAAWGSLVHRLLEHAVRPPRKSAEDLARLARWFSQNNPDLVGALPQAVAAVEEFLASDYGQHVLAGERLVEVPFAVARPHGVLLFGVLDLAVKTPDGWELVDYKTDARAVDQLAQLYGPQVLEYARAWEGVTGEAVTYRGVYGVVSGEMSPNL